MDYRGKLVLVTGAASGIGRACALAFARRGGSLALVDINEAGLVKVCGEAASAGASASPYPADVSDPVQVERLRDRVTSEVGVPDVLLNSAGVAEVAAVEEAPLEDWRHVLGVNLWGAIHTVHFFLPAMYERGSGHVVNLASAAGLMALSYSGLYTTSKFAVVGFSETLRYEAAVHGVGVTVVCPGFVDTPLLDNVKSVGFKQQEAAPLLRKLLPKPEKIAEKIIRAVDDDRHIVVCPSYIRAMLLFKRVAPRWWDSYNRKQTAKSYEMNRL